MTLEELEADIAQDRYQEWLADQAKCQNCGAIETKDGLYDEDRRAYFCDEACLTDYCSGDSD